MVQVVACLLTVSCYLTQVRENWHWKISIWRDYWKRSSCDSAWTRKWTRNWIVWRRAKKVCAFSVVTGFFTTIMCLHIYRSCVNQRLYSLLRLLPVTNIIKYLYQRVLFSQTDITLKNSKSQIMTNKGRLDSFR